MARGSVDIGPLRCVQGPERGIVDVHFDGRVLVLIRYRGFFALLDRYRLVVIGFAMVAAIAGVYVDSPSRIVLLAGAVALGGVVVVLGLVEGVLALARSGGGVGVRAAYRQVRARHGGTRTEVAETDIDLMDPLVEGARPLLVLYTNQGEISLTGWPWRASQLRRLQIELAR